MCMLYFLQIQDSRQNEESNYHSPSKYFTTTTQARYRNEKCDPDVFQLDDYKEAPTHSFGTKKSFHSLHDFLHKP